MVFVQKFGHVGNDYLAILSPRSLHILPNWQYAINNNQHPSRSETVITTEWSTLFQKYEWHKCKKHSRYTTRDSQTISFNVIQLLSNRFCEQTQNNTKLVTCVLGRTLNNTPSYFMGGASSRRMFINPSWFLSFWIQPIPKLQNISWSGNLWMNSSCTKSSDVLVDK